MGFWDIFKRTAKPRKFRMPKMRGRAFAAADTGRLFNGWSTTPESPDEMVAAALPALRARARDQYVNNDFVRRFGGMVKSNVAGPNGVTLQSKIIGRQGTPDYLADRAIEEAFADWGRAENCDIAGKIGWRAMQHQALISAAIDGEILAIMYTGKAYGKYAFQVQHIDPELLDIGYKKDLGDGRHISMGIEYDSAGKRLAYHIKSKTGSKYVRVPADKVIHTFLTDQVGQHRGYPWVSTSLGSLKHLDGYFEAAITAARAGASKMGFIHSQDGVSYTGDGVDDDGGVITDFEAGVIEQLPEGQTFTAFDPKYPHEQFADFTKSMLQSISVSLGVSYSGLSGDLEGVNYSSIRAGVLEEREAWKTLQEWFIDGYCRPIFDGWLYAAHATGAIKILGKPLAGDLEKYQQVVWQGRRWPWVDPQKDMNASILAIENNITTVSAVIREQGKDPENVFQERAKEKQRMAELGLSTAEVISNE